MIGATVCVEHKGRHGVYQGRCFIPAREQQQPFRWRFTTCQDCGCSLDLRYERGERRPLVLEAGTDTVHRCRRPAVDLDAHELADAIVAAARAARQERPAPAPRRGPDPIDPRSPMSGHERTVAAPERPAVRGIPEFAE